MDAISTSSYASLPQRSQKISQERSQDQDSDIAFQKKVARVEQQEETELAHLRDTFSRQYNNIQGKENQTIIDKKNQAEEEIRQLTHDQRAEIGRVKKLGEKEIADIKKTYQRQINLAETQEKKRYAQEVNQNQQLLTYEKKESDEALAHLRDTTQEQILTLNQQSQEQVDAMKKQRQVTVEDMHHNTQESLNRVQDNLEAQYHQAMNSYQKTLSLLNNEMDQRINQLQMESLQKISTYEKQMKDPFYQPLEIQADLKETADEFVLSANVPTYEQESISVHMQDHYLVLNGYRQNKQDLKKNDGTLQASSSYQSYNKKFPLTWEVDAKKISKEMKGDHVIFHVPKSFAFNAKIR